MRLEKYPRWSLVRIEWLDSRRTDGWIEHTALHADNAGGTMPCVSVGMVEHQTAAYIRLCLSRDKETGDVCGTIEVPLVAVTKIRRLR